LVDGGLAQPSAHALERLLQVRERLVPAHLYRRV